MLAPVVAEEPDLCRTELELPGEASSRTEHSRAAHARCTPRTRIASSTAPRPLITCSSEVSRDGSREARRTASGLGSGPAAAAACADDERGGRGLSGRQGLSGRRAWRARPKRTASAAHAGEHARWPCGRARAAATGGTARTSEREELLRPVTRRPVSAVWAEGHLRGGETWARQRARRRPISGQTHVETTRFLPTLKERFLRASLRAWTPFLLKKRFQQILLSFFIN